MQITISTIERNERRNNQARINGFDVQLTGANLQGSDKQVHWAEQIICDLVKDLAKARFAKLGDFPAADAVDAEVATINQFLVNLSKLACTNAADWIDVRSQGTDGLSAMLRKVG
ncbi:hypothetical protein [Xanthomonas axonopodis]|uniref:hypothetical protein n=1 Tax=Xanthomonas axonopodis TaxID=53413 RepID=UPI000D42D328|nr:hypothetical protein [Xanthomonas axonopodis]PPV06802.1 hypothetical protein XavaCFBP5823_19580 [Xanthomonas axonopodis pv. vasculorum]